jgi:exosortase A
VVLFWPTSVSFVNAWATNDTYSHGFLIIPVALYLTWNRRAQLISLRPEPAFCLLPVIATFAGTWLLGHLSATEIVQQLAMVALIIATIWGIVGTAVARALMFPLSFLVFAVPVGAGLIPALQDFSAWIVVKLLDYSGIPVVLEGHFITVPFARWEIAEVCSGLRTLIACVTMGFFYAGLTYRSWNRRLLFMAASVIAPILANGLRIYGVVVLGYLVGNPVAVATDHVVYGWALTSLVILLLLVLGRRWREVPETGQRPSAQSPKPVTSIVQAAPAVVESSRNRRGAGFALLATALAGLAPFYATLAWGWAAEASAVQLFPPASSGKWRSSDRGPGTWQPEFIAPSSELNQTYKHGNRFVTLHIAYFDAGQKDAKVASSSNALYNKSQWRRIQGGYADANCDGRSFRVRETIIRSSDSSILLWNFYWVNGTFTGNDYLAKFLLAVARLTGSLDGSAAIVMATSEQSASPSATALLRDSLSKLSLQDSLRGAVFTPDP